MSDERENIKDNPRSSVARIDLAVRTLKMIHRKHNQGADDIGWSELSDTVHTTLCELMGDKEYCKWLAEKERRDD